MICYVHFQNSGVELHAVAMCKNCGVGLCLQHFAELQVSKPGGMGLSCPHVMAEPRDLTHVNVAKASHLHN